MSDTPLPILLIGKGAREHSLAWKLAKSKSVKHIYVVPGNCGTDSLEKVSNVPSMKKNDYEGMVILAKKLGINLVVAGPDDVIADGVESYFRACKYPPHERYVLTNMADMF